MAVYGINMLTTHESMTEPNFVLCSIDLLDGFGAKLCSSVLKGKTRVILF